VFQQAYTPSASTTVAYHGGASGIINEHMRRANRNLIVANVCLVAAIVGVLAAYQRYFYNFLVGPFPIDTMKLDSITDPDSRDEYYVAIRSDEAVDTGMAMVEVNSRSRREEVEARYLAVAAGEDKFLLVKVEPGFSSDSLAGVLVRMPSTERVEIIRRLEEEKPEARGAFLSIMLDTTVSSAHVYLAMAVGFPLLLLAGWNFKKAISRKSNPSSHPIAQSLERFGQFETVAARIDAEASASGRDSSSGSILVLPSWLVVPRLFGLDALPSREIVWVYKKVTRHYYNFIPVAKTSAVIVCNRLGKSMEIRSPRGEKEADRMIGDILSHAPWAYAGYDDQLRDAWKLSSSRIIQAVDERRKELERQGALSQTG
jgi:hypothetical protein